MLLDLPTLPGLGLWLRHCALSESEYISGPAGRQSQEPVAGWERLPKSQAQLLTPEILGHGDWLVKPLEIWPFPCSLMLWLLFKLQSNSVFCCYLNQHKLIRCQQNN